MSEGYHPEVDDSPLCTEDDSAKYRSIIGCCIWIIVFGRFNIAYANSTIIRFNMLPFKLDGIANDQHLLKTVILTLGPFSGGRSFLISSLVSG
jgi:hypothetical protein